MASNQLYDILDKSAYELEKFLKADVFQYIGPIDRRYKRSFVSETERLAKIKRHDKLYFLITTDGGSVEMTEVMVRIMRHFYSEVYFVVPDYAFSAGTILCMSGDKIYMNYYSSLGPIDPQVIANGKLVSYQGYIDQFEILKEKSKNGTITLIEAQMALNLNLADLNHCIQSRNLTVTLLKDWLVNYKFRNWITHKKTNEPVTEQEKKDRAEEIANKLGDNSLWHSHGRHIGIDTLRNDLSLIIEDLGDSPKLQKKVNDYYAFAVDVKSQANMPIFMHHRRLKK